MTTLKKTYGSKTRKFISNAKTYLFSNNLDLLYKDDIYKEELNSNTDFKNLIINFKFHVSENLNGAAKFLLRNIYTSLLSIEPINLFTEKFTLEHILDKKIKLTDFEVTKNSKEWNKEWEDEIQKSAEMKQFIYKLGNLTLLDETDNNNASVNKGFSWEKKKIIYWGNETNSINSKAFFKIESGSPLEKPIDLLTKEIIENRTKYLAKKIEEFQILKLDPK